MPSRGRRDAEAARAAAEAQIAGNGDLDPAADAIAVDRGNGRLGAVRQRAGRAVDRVHVGQRRVAIAEALVELAYVGPGGEGRAVDAAHDNDLDRRIGLGLRHQRRDRLPHLQVERIALLRPVENEMGNGPDGLEADMAAGPRIRSWAGGSCGGWVRPF